MLTSHQPEMDHLDLAVGDGPPMRIHIGRKSAADLASTPHNLGVIVAHELFAVNPDIRGVVQTLTDAGYLTVAPEFYHRQCAAGRWFQRDDEGRREGFAQLHQLGRDDALADVRAGIGWLREQPGITDIAIIGFSAGGHLAYLAACELPIAKTVSLYAGWLGSTDIPMSQPRPTLELTPSIGGSLLYLVGDDDALIDSHQRAEIVAALDRAGIDGTVVSYPGVEHAFFWEGTPAFDSNARDDAWNRILAFLDG